MLLRRAATSSAAGRSPPGPLAEVLIWINEAIPFMHEGEECVTPLSGSLFMVVDHVECHLEEGDSITLDASKPHWYRNATDRHAVLLGAMTSPSFWL